MEELKLNHNGLTSAALHFPEQNELREIDLSENPIRVLRVNDFANLMNLKKLKITNGQLKTIQAGAFNGLSQLTEIILNMNLLTSAALHFDTSNKLQILDLSGNKFTELRVNDLANLPQLNRVHFHSCHS